MSRSIVTTAAALSIGNELLNGKVQESNLHPLATTLRALGIRLNRTHTFGDRLTPEHLAMARVPAGARLLGTADIRWPTVVMNNVWIHPGVPEIFRMKLAVVRAHLRGAEEFFGRAVFTLLEEAELKPL